MNTRPLLKIAMLGPGSSPHVHRLAGSLADRGHEVHVISEDQFKPFPAIGNLTFHDYPAGGPFHRRARAAGDIIRRLAPDVLHTHAINHGGYVGVASGFHPHVLTAWGSDVFLYPNRSKADRALAWVALRAADLVLSPSAVMQQELRNLGRTAGNELMMWGVDTGHFKFDADRAQRVRAELGVAAGAPMVFCPRILAPLYNQDVLLEAWPKISAAYPGAVLVLSRMRAVADYEAQVRRQADELGISKDIRWVDAVAYEELPARYAAADVIVSIPTSDGMPSTVLEVLACERVVVACDQPSLRQWYAGSPSLSFVNPRDPAEVAGAVLRFLGMSSADRALLGRQARQIVVERADRDHWLAKLESMYGALVDARRGGGYLRTLRNVARP